MGNQQQKNTDVKKINPTELQTYIMIVLAKLTQNRNKRVESIKRKRKEIVSNLSDNNLDIAKAKMDGVLREEDYITVFDILGPLCEILKEKVTYLLLSDKCPDDLRALLDTLIYSSTRLEIEELHKVRNIVGLKYGELYISKANSNADSLVNVNVVEKLRVKPAADQYLIARLKQLCKEENINFEFPQDIVPIINSIESNNQYSDNNQNFINQNSNYPNFSQNFNNPNFNNQNFNNPNFDNQNFSNQNFNNQNYNNSNFNNPNYNSSQNFNDNINNQNNQNEINNNFNSQFNNNQFGNNQFNFNNNNNLAETGQFGMKENNQNKFNNMNNQSQFYNNSNNNYSNSMFPSRSILGNQNNNYQNREGTPKPLERIDELGGSYNDDSLKKMGNNGNNTPQVANENINNTPQVENENINNSPIKRNMNFQSNTNIGQDNSENPYKDDFGNN